MPQRSQQRWIPRKVRITVEERSIKVDSDLESEDAVAESLPSIAGASDTEDDSMPSIAGDTVASDTDPDQDPAASEARQKARNTPSNQFEGNPPEDRSRGASSEWNNEPEVGNLGIFCGNWGTTSANKKKSVKIRRRENQEKQLTKSPAHVLVVLESTPRVADALRQPAVAGVPNSSKLAGRPTCQYYVQRGKEPQSAVLVAARMDTCHSVKCLAAHQAFPMPRCRPYVPAAGSSGSRAPLP